MKKVVMVLCLLAFSQGAFAYIKEGTSTNIEDLQGVGYSQEMLKAIDGQKSRNNPRTYERYYNDTQDSEYTTKAGKAYYKLKLYLDPAQNDHHFGEHEVNFTNGYFPDQPLPNYLKKEKQVDAKIYQGSSKYNEYPISHKQAKKVAKEAQKAKRASAAEIDPEINPDVDLDSVYTIIENL